MQVPPLTRGSAMEATYAYLIDRTLKEAQEFQSPAVLEQVKQRWMERLQAKLAARATATRSFPMSKAPEAPGSGVSAAGNPTTGSAVPIGRAVTEPAAPPKALAHLQSASAPSKELRVAPSESKDVKQRGVPQTAEEDAEDDEWASSEWQEAASSGSPKAAVLTEPSVSEQLPPKGRQDVVNAEARWPAESSPVAASAASPRNPPTVAPSKSSSGRHGSSQAPGERRAGIVVEGMRDIYEDEDIDEASLSDLEDSEPECSDLIVSQFESVQRPHARKTCQRGLWRIKLTNGIMQIDGTELFFKNLSGDLSF